MTYQEIERHPIICAKCGRPDSVPFRPDPNRGPVYCRSCHREIRERRRVDETEQRINTIFRENKEAAQQ